MTATSQTPPEVSLETDGNSAHLVISGNWLAQNCSQSLEKHLGSLSLSGKIEKLTIKASKLEALDTIGGFLILRQCDRLLAQTNESSLHFEDMSERHERLLSAIQNSDWRQQKPKKRGIGLINMLDRIGRATAWVFNEVLENLSFLGAVLAAIFRLAFKPHKIRWASVFTIMEEAGLDAFPIIALLSFSVGTVVAFLTTTLLTQFGAGIFVVELTAIAMLREFGVILTAILLAGRTNSAFAAQIGAMKMRQEVDAMQALGIDVIEALAVPRLLGMLVMLPCLAFGAALAGVAGGMLVAWTVLDIGPVLFLSRMQEVISLNHFWAGLIKAPVFAFVIAMVGCRQGFLVEGDVQSLGNRVTTSVVQGIFLVIVLDAVFALIFREVGL